ncbi:hypothetical protein DCCM_4213 [Desulfocucumis palustris]|uniref:Uncharacterized protein n=1 Tax=Desulfocucumis palustris TaxID=1898651 RepID=A0A2L2XG18_9FIRM|nr:hypothetical protein DCCM_4213 [Desulfocucumis palustris]
MYIKYFLFENMFLKWLLPLQTPKIKKPPVNLAAGKKLEHRL